MKTNKIVFMSYLVIFVLIIFAGCKNDSDNLIAKGADKFERGDVFNASQDFLAISNADPGNIKSQIKFASAGAYLNSNYDLFYNNLQKIGNLSPDFKNLFYFPLEARSNSDLKSMIRSSELTMGKSITNKAVAEEIEAISAAINKNPQNPYYYFARGMWNGQFCNFDGAIKDFSSAIELKKDFWQAYYLRGVFYNHISFYQANDNEFKNNLKAINDFNRVTALNPAFAAVNNNLFLIHQNLDNTKESLEAIEKLYKRDTTKSFYLLKKAELEARDGNHSESIKDYNLLVKKEPANVNYLYGLAIETIASGKKNEGINLLKDALKQCSNRNWENKILKAIEIESARDAKTGKIASNGNKDEFIKLYLAAKEKQKEGKNEEALALLKKAEPLAVNNYYKSRISSLLRDEKRREAREERNRARTESAEKRAKQKDEVYKSKDNKGLNGYRERNYMQGKSYIENGKYDVGIKKLKIALTRTSDKTIQNEIKQMIERAEQKKRASDDNKINKNTAKNYNEHYYVSGKQKLAAGKTKEGIEELKIAYKVCTRNDIKREIKELMHKAGKN